jgi:thioredoxin 1
MSRVLELTESEFESQVLKADRPVLVDFYAPWCGPCRMLAPFLNKLSAEYAGRVKFVKINVDEAPRLAMQYGIQGVPTIIIFRGGLIVEEIVGLPDPRALRRRLDELLPVAAPEVNAHD